MPDLALYTTTYDPFANLELAFDTHTEGIHDRGRRVTRTPTIDGGAVLDDSGLAHADRTWIIRARVTSTQVDTLKYLIDSYGTVRAVTTEGVFTVALDTLELRGRPFATLRALVLRKEA